jgi:hypothetical protein
VKKPSEVDLDDLSDMPAEQVVNQKFAEVAVRFSSSFVVCVVVLIFTERT